MIRKTAAVWTAALVAVILCSCIQKYNSDDAMAYVQAALDAGYRGDFEAYTEITGAKEEQAEAMYQQNTENVTDSLIPETLQISGELRKEYEELVPELLSLAQYEVAGAQEDGDGFAVTLVIRPFSGYKGFSEELESVLAEEMADLEELPEEEQVDEIVYSRALQLLQDCMETPEYEGEELFVVHVERTGGNSYAISEEDLQEMDRAMFPAE